MPFAGATGALAIRTDRERATVVSDVCYRQTGRPCPFGAHKNGRDDTTIVR
ncbi:hypothetical protein CcI6DRAFT_03577 [Frankia sp. CcI6]|nr:hypothetical protein CcI6DRAFT_03577 [Frankia sp. CcI6]KFB03473.1 hypothetical protein ALLO2DRAFT_03809 [Frankia sp. Allo2]OAA21820.1 hypothetical protein AAY23_107019 [Frankia casuarinae]